MPKENFKNLKSRKKELKAIKKLETSATNEHEISLTKQEIKSIRKQNRTPHGNRLLSNTEGNIIDLSSVSKTYVTGKTKFRALDNVSFSIKKGEFIAILGPSGSGKSTLLNVMSGLDRSTEGDIVVNNINIAALKSGDVTTFRRNNVGFIFQSYNLLPELSATDNAEIGRSLQVDGNKRRDIEDIFKQIGIGSKSNSAIGELSGGQMQRVSIARALAKGPDIIFADEPTGALDSESSEQVLALFKEINEKMKTTLILVTHDNEVSKLADRVLYVKDGKVSFDKNGI